jgi:RNA polymerase sigma-70 factor, ECF subfamily
VAIAQCGDPGVSLTIVDGLAASLDDYPYLHSTRAELLRRLHRPAEARSAYQRALGLTRTDPERRFLRRGLAELSDLQG